MVWGKPVWSQGTFEKRNPQKDGLIRLVNYIDKIRRPDVRMYSRSTLRSYEWSKYGFSNLHIAPRSSPLQLQISYCMYNLLVLLLLSPISPPSSLFTVNYRFPTIISLPTMAVSPLSKDNFSAGLASSSSHCMIHAHWGYQRHVDYHPQS